ncbi:cysteine desulfurase [Shimazuella sp. AN120528]|uniref:cysteine desulfurase family protein n=1 Tax=Shimazuella soli TaxID=1892854 RepID=UPI001F118AD5|nr:cysteine desulfurase family protein [Shimazuella soli]MCH5583908.1 cysteine desulfurase [Shimazuella soli]
MHYLDNSATTKPFKEVIELMGRVMEHTYANPASLHGLGFKAEKIVENARHLIAKELNAIPSEIVFTSGGTEANNLAIQGVAKAYQNRGRHIITTKIEHDSVYEVFRDLEKQGYSVTYLSVNESGEISLEELQASLTDKTILVSIMHVNNETGSIQSLEEIGQLLSSFPKLFFHVDAVQSFAKLPIDVNKMKIDLLSLSAHKFHGPKGIGALYLKKNKLIQPLLIGGGQEQGFRSGTLAVPLIVGMGKALEIASNNRDVFYQQAKYWKKDLLFVLSNLNGIVLNGAKGVPYILNFSCPGIKSEVLVRALEEKRLYVSSKSACSSKKETPSRVLLAMGKKRTEAISGIRISMGMLTTLQDIEACSQAISNVIPTLQQWIKV